MKAWSTPLPPPPQALKCDPSDIYFKRTVALWFSLREAALPSTDPVTHSDGPARSHGAEPAKERSTGTRQQV